MNPQISAILDKYIKMCDRDFGLRKGFLSNSLYLFVNSLYSKSLMSKCSEFDHCLECSRVSKRMGRELEKNGSEVKYKTGITGNNGKHIYLEVLDPDTQKWTKLDATPYRKLNLEYKETKEFNGGSEIVPLTGVLLDVEKKYDSFIFETTLSGKCNMLSKVNHVMESKNLAGEIPDYSLELMTYLSKGLANSVADGIYIFVDILDSKRTHLLNNLMEYEERIGNPEKALDFLIKEEIIRLKIEDHAKYLTNSVSESLGLDTGLDINGDRGNSMSYLDELSEGSEDRKKIVEILKGNLGVLPNIVSKLKPTIKTLDGYEFDVNLFS